MSEFINTIDLLGDDVCLKNIVDKTITEFKDDIITNVADSVFYESVALTSVDLPNVTNIGNMSFYKCSALTNINLPNVANIGGNAFAYCTALTKVVLPNLIYPKDYAFGYCSKLETVDLPKTTALGREAFLGCSKLKTLILRAEKKCYLYSGSTFNSTKINSGGGYIYVPRALKDSYSSDSMWKSFSFRALEDYTVDGTTTGELDTTKI